MKRLLSWRPALLGVYAGEFFLESAVAAIIPILPLFLRDRGTSYSLLGLIVGANLVGQFLFQFPAGRLADRFGRRTVMVGALAVAAVMTFALVLPVPTEWLIAFRFLQGAGTAAFLPGANALIADEVPAERRGAAYGWLSSAGAAGFAFGPVIGGVIALISRSAVLEAIGAALVLDALVVLALVQQRHPPTAARRAQRGGFGGLSRVELQVLVAVAAASIGAGFLFGTYNSVWGLFMNRLGATDWQIGLSFTTFSLPFMVVAPFAGRLADRLDRRWLLVGALVVAGLMAPVYPIVGNVLLILLISPIEGIALTFFDTALPALVMDVAPEHRRATTQGALGAFMYAAEAVGSFAGATLFAQGLRVPFVVGSAICVLSVLASVPLFLAAGRPQRVALQTSESPGERPL